MSRLRILPPVLALALAFYAVHPAFADGNLHKAKHIIILMQENHSFDNYFGALAYAPGSPYHAPGDGDGDRDDLRGCRKSDHHCVDGLTCRTDSSGNLICLNSNIDDPGHSVVAFHDSRRCVAPDLDHGWGGTHFEVNFNFPNNTLLEAPMDGFVRVNDATEQHDNGVENPAEDQTMNFYNQNEIPFYYDLAEKFAIDDRFFCSVLGPTFPNRAYLLAATSFGHLTTGEIFPPTPAGYKPITGTIFDLLDKNKISWADYFQDVPQGGTFRPFTGVPATTDPHFLPLKLFLAQAAGVPGVGPLPEVSFVDPDFGVFGKENDEHPPTDIQRGQAFVSQVVNAVRNGPFWKDSVIFITYDEHGGSYDHVKPPRARQGHARTPDGIVPGLCADASNPPASEQPGGGAECKQSFAIEKAFCAAFAANPTGPFPDQCASFDQLGLRVPFIAVSPFSKRHYVSHTVGDHTSLLAFIEKRFMPAETSAENEDEDNDADDTAHQHLTGRDQHASTLEDLFDFDRSPSLHTMVGQAAPPVNDCTPR